MNADAEDAYVEPEVGLSDVGQFIIKDSMLSENLSKYCGKRDVNPLKMIYSMLVSVPNFTAQVLLNLFKSCRLQETQCKTEILISPCSNIGAGRNCFFETNVLHHIRNIVPSNWNYCLLYANLIEVP